MAVSVKMGVDVSQFKAGMQQAQQSAKTLQTQLKANEAQFKATGDKEQYLANQSKLLKQQLEAQKTAAKNAEQAMKAMRDNGVSETSREYQNLARQLAEAQAGMYNAQHAMDVMSTSAGNAATQADNLQSSLSSINKKVSLDAVNSGLEGITKTLERVAAKAREVGRTIWTEITESAARADDTVTQAMILNMDVEEYQKYKKVFDTEAELTVAEWQKAQQKVKSAVLSPSNEQIDILEALGISTHEMQATKYGVVEGAARDAEEVFWEIGETLRSKVESGEISQDLADVYANVLFGKGFANLNPIFAMGEEGFKEAVEAQTAASKEAMEAQAKLNDKLIELQGNFNTLKDEIMGGLAPSLTTVAETLSGLLQRLIEYAQSPDGQKALADLGKSVEGIFSDITTIEPDKVVQGFADVFNGIIGSMQWLDKNKDAIVTAMEVVAGGWAAIKLTGGVLKIIELVNGLRELRTIRKINLPELNGGNGGTDTGTGGTGMQNVTTESVTTQNVTAATITNATVTNATFSAATFATGNTTTENVATMYVGTMIGGNGMPGTQPTVGNNGGQPVITTGGPGFIPLPVNGGGYANLPGTGTQNLGSGNTTLNLPAGNDGSITLQADEFRITDGSGRPIMPSPDISFGPDTVMYDGGMGMGVGFVLNEYDRLSREFKQSKAEHDYYMDKYRPDLSSEEAKRAAATIFLDKDVYSSEEAARKLAEQFGTLTEEEYAQQKALQEGTNATEKLADAVMDTAIAAWNAAQRFNAVVIAGGYKTGDDVDAGGAGGRSRFLGGGGVMVEREYANGLPYVPWDGYPAILHKGERVVPAREAGRSYNSNLYVESMIMNNGTDAAGLAAAMAAAQRRTMSGYGS